MVSKWRHPEGGSYNRLQLVEVHKFPGDLIHSIPIILGNKVKEKTPVVHAAIPRSLTRPDLAYKQITVLNDFPRSVQSKEKHEERASHRRRLKSDLKLRPHRGKKMDYSALP